MCCIISNQNSYKMCHFIVEITFKWAHLFFILFFSCLKTSFYDNWNWDWWPWNSKALIVCSSTQNKSALLMFCHKITWMRQKIEHHSTCVWLLFIHEILQEFLRWKFCESLPSKIYCCARLTSSLTAVNIHVHGQINLIAKVLQCYLHLRCTIDFFLTLILTLTHL